MEQREDRASESLTLITRRGSSTLQLKRCTVMCTRSSTPRSLCVKSTSESVLVNTRTLYIVPPRQTHIFATHRNVTLYDTRLHLEFLRRYDIKELHHVLKQKKRCTQERTLELNSLPNRIYRLWMHEFPISDLYFIKHAWLQRSSRLLNTH